MRCRHCAEELRLPMVDLGSAPPSNAYLTAEALGRPEAWYPLRVLVCEQCWLAQTEDIADARELFDADYAYFSGFSTTWVAHCERYVDAMCERFELDEKSFVVEVAANDGHLLHFVQRRGIPCVGVEPTASTAAAARDKGIEVIQDFFGERLAEQLVTQRRRASLTAANNVLAHVPDINDFVAGFRALLEPDGVATFEFPHLATLIAGNQFDTIYHEHFSYLSLTAVARICEGSGLTVFDVERHPTHGGSLRVFAQRSDVMARPVESSVQDLLDEEAEVGVTSRQYYADFQARTERTKNAFLAFLLEAKREGKTVAAYGAAAKGNTLLNYAGIREDLIAFVVDRNPAKQGKFCPGSRIPIVAEPRLSELEPDFVVVLPWNLATEIGEQLHYVKAWGGRLVTAVPELRLSE